MASAKVATKAAADDRTDMVIPPSMCAASLSSLIFLRSGREYGATAWWPPSIRDSEEPFSRPIRTQAYCPLRATIKPRPPSKPYQQSRRVRTCVDWDAVAQSWHRRPAFGLGSAGTGLTRTSFAVVLKGDDEYWNFKIDNFTLDRRGFIQP